MEELLKAFEEQLADYGKVKDNLFIRAYSSSKVNVNETALVAKDIQGIVLIPAVSLGSKAMVNVTRDLLTLYNISEEQLWLDAFKSSAIICPAAVKHMSELIGLMFGPDASDLLVCLSNADGGAAAFFYPGLYFDQDFKPIAEQRFFVIPSSRHELILLDIESDEMLENWKDFNSIIHDINADKSIIHPDDFLSDDLYYYDGSEGIFGKAKDVLAKK